MRSLEGECGGVSSPAVPGSPMRAEAWTGARAGARALQPPAPRSTPSRGSASNDKLRKNPSGEAAKLLRLGLAVSSSGRPNASRLLGFWCSSTCTRTALHQWPLHSAANETFRPRMLLRTYRSSTSLNPVATHLVYDATGVPNMTRGFGPGQPVRRHKHTTLPDIFNDIVYALREECMGRHHIDQDSFDGRLRVIPGTISRGRKPDEADVRPRLPANMLDVDLPSQPTGEVQRVQQRIERLEHERKQEDREPSLSVHASGRRCSARHGLHTVHEVGPFPCVRCWKV